MEIVCSEIGCTSSPFIKCFCSDELLFFCKTHMMDHINNVNKPHCYEKIKILSQEETKNDRIKAFKDVYNNLHSIKSKLTQKVEALYQPKINKLYGKIDSDIEEVSSILEYLETDQNQNFYENFRCTFEESLSKYQNNSKLSDNEVNFIEDFAILTKENAWRYQIGEEEKDSDYRKLISETTPFKLDELYSYAILRFLDYFEAGTLSNSFFNLTNFCDKEKILLYTVEKLTDDHKKLLYNIVLMTRWNKNLAQAGSNSMSILIKAEHRFDREDLSGICIPQANLSNGVFYKTNFSKADLSNCVLSCAQFLDVTLNRTALPKIKPNKEFPRIKVYSVAISHNGAWVAICQYDRITIYDAYTSKKQKECYEQSINDFLQVVSWSYDDRFIASCDWLGTVFIWEWDDSSEFSQLISKIMPAQGSLTKVLWAPNDYRIASCRTNGTIKIWDAFTNETIFEDQDVLITVLAWSSSGKYLAYYCANEIIRILDSETRRKDFNIKTSKLYALEWIYNEKYLYKLKKLLLISKKLLSLCQNYSASNLDLCQKIFAFKITFTRKKLSNLLCLLS
ncbi:unnamed protein product [Blepharisma stoltei]|uniref:Anaphase-promoting complex subunit 4-like WD40 domain-containing protein n=1 Tax=Blepharisma stoltei TaxID=1481888 RepID=A0AAU9IXT2_9CILI|nr:unnamed protein product [Blepharisma stoltei]